MTKRFLTPLSTDHVDFNTTTTSSSGVGRVAWNDGEGTIDVGLKGGNLDLHVGQEEFALCYNGTGSTLSKGTAVYISGSQGQRPTLEKATSVSESGSSKTFGIVAENIDYEQEGFVATFGLVRGLNTLDYAEGSALWLSSSAGLITTIKPVSPNHLVFIGYCIRNHESSGQIFVNIQNGYEIEELHDVLISSPTNGQVLTYDSTTQLWKNQDSAAAQASQRDWNLYWQPSW